MQNTIFFHWKFYGIEIRIVGNLKNKPSKTFLEHLKIFIFRNLTHQHPGHKFK